MSTRYVWEKYEINPPITLQTQYGYRLSGFSFSNEWDNDIGLEIEIFSQAPTSKSYCEDGTIDYQGKIQRVNNRFAYHVNGQSLLETFTVPLTTLYSGERKNLEELSQKVKGKYFKIKRMFSSNTTAKNADSSAGWRVYGCVYFCPENINPGFYLYHPSQGADITLHVTVDSIQCYTCPEWSSINGSTSYKGAVLGQLSSDTSDRYSNKAYLFHLNEANEYAAYLIYKGSDNIDPAAVSLPEELRPGEEITVSLTPGSGKKYGGAISYLYQYQFNGGSWTNINTTSAESIAFTVPSNAKTLQFRARAQDDMGFTSATYISSEKRAVNGLKAFVGVNGKARKGVALYVGVNGKARRAVAAYIGVNGKARRFL